MSTMNDVLHGRVHCPPDQSEAGYNLQAAFPDFPQVLESWRTASAALRQAVTPELDIEYGNKPLQRLDFYRASDNAPLLVFIHGGYWQGGDKSDVGFIAQPYLDAGISVAVINYTLAPQARVEDMVDETRQAMSWLYDHAARFSVDPKRFSVMGHSAGGHLAAMLVAGSAEQPENRFASIANVFGISGVYDLPPLVPSSINNALSLDEARALALSPVFKAGPTTTRIYTIIGEHETQQFHAQSAALAQCWSQVVEHCVVPDTHHYTVLNVLGDASSPACQMAVNAILQTAP